MTKKLIYLPNKYQLLQLEKGFKPCSVRSWSRDIKKLYGHKCFVTGLVADKDTKLYASRYLFSKKQYPNLAFSLLNGLPLTKAEGLNKEFHLLYGLNVDINCFLHYIKLKQSQSTNNNYIHFELLIDWVEFLKKNIQ